MILYLRSRRIGLTLVIIVLLAIANAVTGRKLLTLIIGTNLVTISYRFVFGAFIASTIINSLASPLESTDRGDTGVVRKARWRHLVGLSMIGLLLAAVSSATETGGDAIGAIRAYLAWSGLALLAAGLLRESLSWIGALFGIFILAQFGYVGRIPTPWNWAEAPLGAHSSWWVSVIFLLIGLLLHRRRYR